MEGLDCLGVDEEVGFDYGGLLQAAGGVATYGVSAAEQAQKESKLKADETKAANDAIAADIAASNAVAKAAVSAQLKQASASIDATAAQMALDAQDRAGANLSVGAAKKRAEAADQALAGVVKNSQANPKDGYATALVAAWKATANKAHSTAIVLSDGTKGHLPEESWFTKPVMGKVPGYGVLAIGAGALGILGVVVKKVFFK
jgi:hypothetical protein